LPADPCLLPAHSLPSTTVTDEEFWSGLNANLGVVRARATAGQGQTVALGRNVMRQESAQVGKVL